MRISSGYGPRPADGGFEPFSWYFMRISAIGLFFLAILHLIFNHVTTDVACTSYQLVALRYANPYWRVYDWLLLTLALLHGMNGLRVVVDDYVRIRAGRISGGYRRVNPLYDRHRYANYVPTCSRKPRSKLPEIRRKEIPMPVDNELYDRLASTWWDENETLNMLRTVINPGRFGYFRAALLETLKIDPGGKQTLDVGCGGGLLSEEFARLGCIVTGVDPSEPSLVVARNHAQQQSLMIDYRVGFGESLPFADASFDIVCCCDVLEHVKDLEMVISEIARVLKTDGIFFYDTINRTFISKIVTIKLLQEWKMTSVMPPNIHDWNMFIKPRELQALMARYGLVQQEIAGLVPGINPLILINLLLKLKQGKLSFKEVASRIKLVKRNDTSNLFMGYALKVSDSKNA